MSGETTIQTTLLDHRFQGEEPPGLYPEADTVCSCQVSPPTAPDDDYEWWVAHIVLMLEGHQHTFEAHNVRWDKCTSCGDCRKVDRR